jgi:hypothetical protein
MAMSQGELMSRRLQESKRFLSRQQTKDSSLQTYIVQAKASTKIFTPTPTAQTVQGSHSKGTLEKAIPNNTYQATPVQACCSVVYASGNETFENSGTAVAMKNVGAAICCGPDYATQNGYSIDLNTLGAYCCPLPNLPNTAKVPAAFQCASCQKFYFPVPAQPSLCTGCGTTYPQTQLYPPQPLDWELRRYGEAGVPRVGGTSSLPTNIIT